MKTYIKKYLLTSLLLLAFAVQVEAQTSRSSTSDRTINTTGKSAKKTTTSSRVASSKVTYKTPTKKVVSVRNVPNKTVIRHGGQNYYYANDRYYTQSRGRYFPIAPKVGFRIQTLPENYNRVHYNHYDYFNSHGTFYLQINNQYEVVEPEIGTIVYELPDDYEKVVIDGLTYYEYANILYEKVQVDGERAYEVVGLIDMAE
ncbi:MAG: DUF6515 family protein [Sediminibacterium sp.]